MASDRKMMALGALVVGITGLLALNKSRGYEPPPSTDSGSGDPPHTSEFTPVVIGTPEILVTPIG